LEKNIDGSEPLKEPSPEPSESPEDPKDIARAMLMAGKPDEEVAEETGLKIRSVWGIKGGLTKSGHIPSRAERQRMERREPGPEESKFLGEEEGDRIPFRRLAPPHVLVERVLKKFGVKDRSRDIIVDRCRTAGGMHPSELEKALRSLDTGLSKVSEINFIVEDYYLSLQAETDKSREFSEGRGSYPIRRGETGYSGGRYPLGEDQPDTGRRWGYDKSLYGRPRDRYEPGREGTLTRRDIMELLERRERDLEDRMRRSTLEDKMGSIGEDISVLATELRNLKENPQVQPAPTGPSEYEKALEHTIERQDRRQDELMSLVKEERSESKEDMKELRETYGGRVKELQEDLKTAERKVSSRSTTEGYKSDDMRLAADGFNRLADIFESRGSPVRIMVEGLPKWLGEGERPPQRERGQPASVADLVGPEYVEV